MKALFIHAAEDARLEEIPIVEPEEGQVRLKAPTCTTTTTARTAPMSSPSR